jgi:hypothetical protein
MSIPVVLDSTVYKQTPQLNSKVFLLLRKMCRIETIRLYLPRVIEREYMTWIDERINESRSAIIKAMSTLNRLLPEKNPIGLDLMSYIADNQMKGRKAETFVNWESFKTDAKIVEVPLAPAHGRKVMTAYFEGTSPFSGMKVRDDIPDGFIYSAVMDILRKEKRLYFVTADKKFAATLSTLKGVTVANDLSSFFQVEEIAQSTGVRVSGNTIDSLRKILLFYQDEIVPKYHALLKAEIDAADVASQFTESFMQDPQALHDASTLELDLDMSKILEIEPNTFIFPFSARVEAELMYGIEAGELWHLGKERIDRLHSREEQGIGYYDIVEGFPGRVNGSFSLVVSKNDPKNWSDVSKEIDIKVESIDIDWQ